MIRQDGAFVEIKTRAGVFSGREKWQRFRHN